jgi:hypothetical protein
MAIFWIVAFEQKFELGFYVDLKTENKTNKKENKKNQNRDTCVMGRSFPAGPIPLPCTTIAKPNDAWAPQVGTSLFSFLSLLCVRAVRGGSLTNSQRILRDSSGSATIKIEPSLLPSGLPVASTLRRLGFFVVRRRPCFPWHLTGRRNSTVHASQLAPAVDVPGHRSDLMMRTGESQEHARLNRILVGRKP